MVVIVVVSSELVCGLYGNWSRVKFDGNRKFFETNHRMKSYWFTYQGKRLLIANFLF